MRASTEKREDTAESPPGVPVAVTVTMLMTEFAPTLNWAESWPKLSTVHAGKPLVSITSVPALAESVQPVSVGDGRNPVPVTVTTVAAAEGGPTMAGKPVVGFKVMAGAAHARGRSPSDGRLRAGIVIFGILTCVNGSWVIETSGIWTDGMLRFGKGTNNPVVTKSIMYTRLARRVDKPITPSNCRVSGCSEMKLIMLLSLPYSLMYNIQPSTALACLIIQQIERRC